ncbi:MAG TPA: tetratricopeptide repeat protein [Acidimicrobiales bacterium]|nr:tetratricopeptide repeat protein [Acidimicrobiales bacterium]
MLDVTDDTFEADVLVRSETLPVVVDLWAPWCGPCKTLGPILEAVVASTEGRVELAKINVDENPRSGATFRVQSIPAVFALRDRKIVDSFIGALPEAGVKAFVERLAPSASPADRLVAVGTEDALRAALDLQPDHSGAVVALAELLVGSGSTEEALGLLARVPETADVRRVAALARMGGADAVPSGDGVSAKLDALLERVKGDEAARQEFLDLLEVLGPEDPRTMRYRRAMTSRLF